MLLTESDLAVLRTEVATITKDQEQLEETFQKVKKGYEDYATEEMITGDRNTFFKENITKLLERLPFTGKTTSQAFNEGLWDHLRNTLNLMGVPAKDLEDVAADCALKLLRFNYVEKYNPLRASWSHFISVPLRRMRATYYEKRSRDPIALGFSYQSFDGGQTEGDDEFNLELYTQDQELGGYEKMLVGEILKDFEVYLSKQRSRRPGRQKNYIATCKIHPPRTAAHKKKIRKGDLIQEPQIAYLVRKGNTQCHRIQTQDGRSLLWPKDLVTDISYTTEKVESELFTRSLADLYRLVMETGAQVQKLASLLQIGDSTVHAWISSDGDDSKPETWGLERHFREWWSKSNQVPDAQKWRSRKTRKCSCCGYEHLELPAKVTKPAVLWYEIKTKEDSTKFYVTPNCKLLEFQSGIEGEPPPAPQVIELEAHWCDECGHVALDNVENRYEIPYPWGKVRGHEELKEKALLYKPRMTVPVCRL